MKQTIKVWFCVCVYLLILEWQAYAQLHPDVYLSLENRIKRHGYPLEVHEITTEDGYILSAYRIPHGHRKLKDESRNKSVVLLMHGMGGCPHNWNDNSCKGCVDEDGKATVWSPKFPDVNQVAFGLESKNVLLGGKDSLPYYLADRGFDVWLGGSRGLEGYFKKNHIKYDWNEDPEYWDFSLHEIGIYDLAAILDYIILHTNQPKIFFVGHSAAVPEFFILLSERPEYNEKIKIAAHYASAPIIKRMNYSLVSLLCSLVNIWKGIFKYLAMVEVLPQIRMFIPTAIAICQDQSYLKICVNVLGLVGSHNSVLMEDNVAALAATAIPRMATKLVVHFMDNLNDGDFRQFNHGRKKNMRLYGQKYPPKYKLSNCLVPVAFYYGPMDHICVKLDIYESINELPNVILEYEVPFPGFTHIDFIVSRNSTYLLYEPTYQLFRNYDEGRNPKNIGQLYIPGQ